MARLDRRRPRLQQAFYLWTAIDTHHCKFLPLENKENGRLLIDGVWLGNAWIGVANKK
jgi:hypothetical protein